MDILPIIVQLLNAAIIILLLVLLIYGIRALAIYIKQKR